MIVTFYTLEDDDGNSLDDEQLYPDFDAARAAAGPFLQNNQVVNIAKVTFEDVARDYVWPKPPVEAVETEEPYTHGLSVGLPVADAKPSPEDLTS